jgi:hypothetical protein
MFKELKIWRADVGDPWVLMIRGWVKQNGTSFSPQNSW